MPISYYICPRCSYQTKYKVDMDRHFNRKSKCSNTNDLELTNEITKYVLENHIYHKPKNNTLQTNNIILNMVNQLDIQEKLNYILDYQGKELLDLEDSLEQQFEHRVERLDNNEAKYGYFLDYNDILGIISSASTIKRDNIEQFNIMYDRIVNKINLYRGKSWESLLVDTGIKELVGLIKSYYLNNYELYLIRNLHDRSTSININSLKLKEHLDIYYKFLITFELLPCVVDYTDNDIVNYQLVEHNPTYLSDYYMKHYFSLKKDIKLSEINKTKNKIEKLVKDANNGNIKILDKTINELLKFDENFKNELLANLNSPKTVSENI